MFFPVGITTMFDLTPLRTHQKLLLLSQSEAFLQYITDTDLIIMIKELSVDILELLTKTLKKHDRLSNLEVQKALISRDSRFLKDIDNPSTEILEFSLKKLDMYREKVE